MGIHTIINQTIQIMETIEINRLEIRARHGVGEQERVVGNIFLVDVHLDVDLSRAMVSDNVDDTISYAIVIDLIKHEMSIPSALLENAVWRIRQAITTAFPTVTGGMVRLAKVTPPVPGKIGSAAVVTRW